YPLVLGGASIVASVIGTFFVKARGTKIMNALYAGVAVSAVLAAIAFWPITSQLMAESAYGLGRLYGCALIGLVLTGAMVVITEYYIATEYQ
ncbi:sodium/proton-translocating pyrophosphatase, partial [Salmonella enterica]|uniref:sodium/proton-translocating pyrophosphatase n=1 Tax=Salmonella enterica TaxID=28901 RepID=UPI0021B3C9AE